MLTSHPRKSLLTTSSDNTVIWCFLLWPLSSKSENNYFTNFIQFYSHQQTIIQVRKFACWNEKSIYTSNRKYICNINWCLSITKYYWFMYNNIIFLGLHFVVSKHLFPKKIVRVGFFQWRNFQWIDCIMIKCI